MRIALAVCCISAFLAFAQTEPSDQTKPQIKSLSHAIHAVNDLDTTLKFYHDVFGLNGMPQDFPNPAVPQLTNAPGVTLRLSMMRLPGSMLFELTHFKGLERKPAQAAYTDPGAASIVLHVRDIDTAVANAKKGEMGSGEPQTAAGEDQCRSGQGPVHCLARSRWFLRSSGPGNAPAGCAGRQRASGLARLHDGERRLHGQVL